MIDWRLYFSIVLGGWFLIISCIVGSELIDRWRSLAPYKINLSPSAGLRLYVNVDGNDSDDCRWFWTPCGTVQGAINRADEMRREKEAEEKRCITEGIVEIEMGPGNFSGFSLQGLNFTGAIKQNERGE